MKYISISLIRLQSDSGITCKFCTSSCSSRINVFQSFCCQWKKNRCNNTVNTVVGSCWFCPFTFPWLCLNQQVFSYTMLQQSTSLKAIVCCLIIIAGFFMGVDQEGVAGKNIFMKRHTCIFNTNRHINWKQITEGSIDHKVSLIKKFSSWYFHYFS